MIKRIGIVGGGISGLVTAIFLAKEGYKVSIFEKNTLLSETSSKTTKLLHGGLRYLENFHFREVKNGLNDRHWWLKNFPQHTNKIKISIPFINLISIDLLKFFFGVKLYGLLAGPKSLGNSELSLIKKSSDDLLNENYKLKLSFFDGVMDDNLLGEDLIKQAKELDINIFENYEILSLDINGKVDKQNFDNIILAVGPWTKILLQKSNIKSLKDIDYIKGSHLILNKQIKFGIMFNGICNSRYIFALPYKGLTLLGTTEERVESPENPSISQKEESYLLESFNSIIKYPVRKEDILSSYSGVRPLIKEGENSHKASRDFFIQKNNKLISIFGGKWTTAPSIARKIVTIINDE